MNTSNSKGVKTVDPLPITEKVFRIIPMIEYLTITKERNELKKYDEKERGALHIDLTGTKKKTVDKKKKKKYQKRDEKAPRSPILRIKKKKKKKKKKKAKTLQFDPSIKTTTRYPEESILYIEHYENLFEKIKQKYDAKEKLQEDITLKRVKTGRSARTADFGKMSVSSRSSKKSKKKKAEDAGEPTIDPKLAFLSYDKNKLKEEYAKLIVMKEKCKRELLGAKRYYGLGKEPDEETQNKPEEEIKEIEEAAATQKSSRKSRRSKRTG